MNYCPSKIVITIDISNLSLIESEQINRGMIRGFSLAVPTLDLDSFVAKSARWDICMIGVEE